MSPTPAPDLTDFDQVIASLRRGDFSMLDPLFDGPPNVATSPLATWVETGRFSTEASALNEALACACFNGRTPWVPYLLTHGANLEASNGTGLNGLHWAANRGHPETVQALLAQHPNLESQNAYGGTVLSATVWAAVHEPKPAHLAIVEALLAAGADVQAVDFPSGHWEVDQLLQNAGARP
jgi:hypothetical protein